MSEFDDRMALMMFATSVWDAALRDPGAVTPVLTLLRGPRVNPVTFAVMSHYDTSDLDLIRKGVVPLVTPDVETAVRVLRPYVQRLDVRGAVFCTKALALKGAEKPVKMLALWSYDLPSGSETRWIRAVNDDGTLSGPVDLGDAQVIGADWIKAVLT